MTQISNPGCGSCELRCDLTDTKAKLTTALDAMGSPVTQAEFGVTVAQYDRDGLLEDQELMDMSGQNGNTDPDAAASLAEQIATAAEGVTAAHSELELAHYRERTSFLLSGGPSRIASIDEHLAQLGDWCPGPRRGFTLPLIGFVALGFGPATRCGSPRAPLSRNTVADIKQDYSLPQ